ncbi:cupin domain-containing protein [Halorarum halobium]|uniref:cupin domain-containing protein n=1 Tax=Halorarum halobium TaxID=3075121 RepID=UPI0028B1F243|nr:cupin domain-containing protein [Halobaculum sp. XH14]
MVAHKNYAALPRQKPFKVKATASPTVAEAGETADGDPHMTIYSTVLTNDFISTWTTGEPGATIPWHSHSPEMYQVLFNVEGRCRWHYKDNDGTERSIDGNPGEVIYLPAGAENRVEVIGDEQHTHIGALKRPRVPRLEHLMGETEGLYDHTEFPAALVYDDMNDRVVRQVDSALVD